MARIVKDFNAMQIETDVEAGIDRFKNYGVRDLMQCMTDPPSFDPLK